VSIVIVLTCDGQTPGGDPCRGWRPVAPWTAALSAVRAAAVDAGWSIDGDRTLCPACTRRTAAAVDAVAALPPAARELAVAQLASVGVDVAPATGYARAEAALEAMRASVRGAA
jgi:hypothetical protein